MLRRLGWQFQPDLLVIQFFVNDALPSGSNFASKSGDWIIPNRRLLPVRFRSGPVDSSALLAFVEKRINALMNGPRPFDRFKELYLDNAEGWHQARASLREIADSAAARGVPALLVLFPYFIPGSWTAETYPLQQIHETVAAYARGVGFRVLDLTYLFAEQGGDWRRWWATPYDSHPGVAAQAIMARAIADDLIAGPLRPSPSVDD